MSNNSPPYPSGDLRVWAEQLYSWILNDEVTPDTILLEHQTDGERPRATTAGMLMFDPSIAAPVYSESGAWRRFAGATAGPVFPDPPAENMLHFLSAGPVGFYMYFNDGDSTQWVEVS